MHTLEEFGWDAGWSAELDRLEAHALPGRVTAQHRSRWTVQLASGASPARITSHSIAGAVPVTGDWVLLEPGPSPADPLSILHVLPRRSAISRGAAGSGATEQVLAANIDVVWIVEALDRPFSPRRIERYLAVVWESGALPEIVLTKADLVDDAESIIAQVESVAIGVPVRLVSAHRQASIDALRLALSPASTVALLGLSGAGKSTLINALAQEAVAATGEVREDDHRGRHTTTHRELYALPGGALLLDTPGLRELRVWDLGEGLLQAFPEIEELAGACHFRDCRHESEPGCAVLAAVSSGALDAARLESFRKLRAEAAYVERKSDPEAQAAAVAKHKTALKTLKYHPKYRKDQE